MSPVLQDLAILDAEYIYGLDLHSLDGWSNSLDSPLWVPRMVTLAVTLSPSAITPSTLMVRSGKPSRASHKVSLKVSMSLAGLREGVRYRGD